ncbi:MAG TPA: tyrosine-type recombinase/integrase [Capsulimonadaceae bacterium]|nr:tyrosine-type recombinase/integrase [Capsulimonadaceae bacterium]
MKKTALTFASSDAAIKTDELVRCAEGWLLDGDIRLHSRSTHELRRHILCKLEWFLTGRGFTTCGLYELRQFFAYLTRGHEDKGGRWQNAQLKQPARPQTVHTYYSHLRTFFRWLVSEGIIERSPVEAIAPPIARTDQILPFSEPQVASLLQAAKRSHHARRDEAIVLMLLDTGMRASELCTLRFTDLDMQTKRCTVLGKGNKHRSVYFGRTTAKALWQYLRLEDRDSIDPLFLSDRGHGAGEALTRSGLLQLIRRLGKAASIDAARCSPHTFRHTFAVTFLRNGGNVFTLMQLLGHTSLTMTNRYVALAQADMENQHRLCSPVDHLRKATGGRS